MIKFGQTPGTRVTMIIEIKLQLNANYSAVDYPDCCLIRIWIDLREYKIVNNKSLGLLVVRRFGST